MRRTERNWSTLDQPAGPAPMAAAFTMTMPARFLWSRAYYPAITAAWAAWAHHNPSVHFILPGRAEPAGVEARFITPEPCGPPTVLSAIISAASAGMAESRHFMWRHHPATAAPEAQFITWEPPRSPAVLSTETAASPEIRMGWREELSD